jgi:dipeptidyl aminopeptidase/acylaminoacyl peptidase
MWRHRIAACAATLVLGMPGAAWAQALPDNAFTIDRLIDMTRVSSPALSPDGAHVLFTRSDLDWSKNKRNSRLWIANADGSDARPFTAEPGDGAARWSPDGRYVAFLRAAGGGNGGNGANGNGGRTRQIFLIRTDGGEARQLMKHATSVRRFEWAKDGSRIFFVAPDSLTKAEKDARKNGDDAIAVDEGPNGQGRGQWSNLWWVAVDFDSAQSEPLTEGHRMIGDFVVAPDGRSVAFTYRTEDRRNDGFRSEIAVVDVATKEIKTLTHNEAPESRLAWSPDNRTLTFVAPDLKTWKLDQGNLYAMDVASGQVRQLMPSFNGDMSGYEWAPDGRTIHFAALDSTVSNLYALDTRSGRVQKLSDFDGVIGSPSFSHGHDVVAFTMQSPTSPGEIYTAKVEDMKPVAITDVNAKVRALDLSTPELVHWTSRDGHPVDGLLYLPPGGRDHPGAMVLYLHGGPAGVFTRRFDGDAQVLAAYGYAVLEPNVRGSSGYGDAWLRGNTDDIGGGDFQDAMTGVDAMVQRGVADPDSLAVRGWSYGGILGGWTITQTNRFKAASLGAMVADWVFEYGVGFNYDVTRWYLGGDPWSKQAFWIERSSYMHADRVQTPTILFHGDEDTTDTPGQSMDFFAALEHFGVPVRLLRFPREPHGFREPHHQRIRYVEEMRWFQKYVRGQADWKAPERPGPKTATAGK